jgi:hypothetical protein
VPSPTPCDALSKEKNALRCERCVRCGFVSLAGSKPSQTILTIFILVWSVYYIEPDINRPCGLVRFGLTV